MTQSDSEHSVAAGYARFIEALPGRRLQVSGALALAAWEKLRRDGGGWPLVIGSDDDLARVAEQTAGLGGTKPAPADVLAKAAALRHPADLRAKVDADEKRARAFLETLPPEQRKLWVIEVGADGQPRSTERDMLDEAPREPPLGEWPAQPMAPAELSVATEFVEKNGRHTSRPLEKANLLVLPTADWTEAPAYLNWGGWNACPAPEYHVAAFRSWRDRYGAELVGISADTLNLRVARRPETRDEALALAREFYLYCPDSIEQGAQTFSALAAALMANEWWYFWWD